MPGVTIEGILQVNDEGGSGPGVDVNITGPIGSQPSTDSVSVTLASDEPAIHVIVDSSPPVGVTNDGTFAKETGGHLESIDAKLIQDQQVAASSLSVVIASDQSPIPVTGSFTPGSNTATGTLSTNSGAGSTLEIDTEGMNTVAGYNSAQAGGFSESLSVQGQVSGSTDWFAIPYLQFDSGTATNRLSGLVPAATVFFQVNCAAFSKVRLLRFASSTGTTTWFLASTPATIDSIQQVLLMSSNGQNISSTNGHLDVEVQGTANVQATNLDIRDLLFATDKVDASGSSVTVPNIDVALSTRLNTLGQKAMVASAPVVIASDQSAIPVSGSISVSGSVPITELDTIVSGTLTAVAQTIEISTDGRAVVFVQQSITGAVVSAFGECTIDDITWYRVHYAFFSGPQSFLFSNLFSDGFYTFDVAGAKKFRLRCTAYTSGTGTYVLRASSKSDSITRYMNTPFDDFPDSTISLPVVGQTMGFDGTNWDRIRSSASNPAGTETGLIVRNIPSGTQSVSSTGPSSSTTTRVPPAWRQTVTLLAANSSRKEAQIVNGTNAPMYLYEGAGASDVTYTDIVPPRAKYILDGASIITGFWNKLPTEGWVFATDRQ